MRRALLGLSIALAACSKESLPLCPANTISLAGVCRVSCIADDDCLNGERCEPTTLVCVRSDELAPPPVIELFVLNPATIGVPGQEVIIEYRAINTTSIDIEPNVLSGGRVTNGIVRVFPEDSTEYMLTARGPGGEVSLRRSVALVGGRVAIVDFSILQPNPAIGDTVMLHFEVENAKARSIRLSEPATGGVVADELPDRGYYDLRIGTLPLELMLEARGANDERAWRTLRIVEGINGAPEVNLDANPADIADGDTAVLEWVTRNASELRLSENDAEFAVRNDRFEVSRGFEIVGPLNDTRYTAVVSDGSGTAQAEANIAVRKATTPEIISFSVEPRTRSLLQAEVPVMVNWDVAGVDSVALYENETLIGEFSAQGSHTGEPRENLHYRLEAKSPDGKYVEAKQTAWMLDVEHQLFVDNPIDRLAREATLITIDPDDTFPIRVFETGTLDVFLASREAVCDPNMPVLMELENSDGDVFDTGSNIDGCLRIRRNDLPAGQYTVRLRSGERVEYGIFGRFAPNLCGDHLFAGMEECDDGGRVNGDGCSDVCTLETTASYTVEARSTPSFDLDRVVLNPLVFNEGVAQVKLPFELPFFDNIYRGLFVREDGFLALRPEDRATPPSTTLINEARPNAIIAAFMSEMKLADFPDARGEVFTFIDPSSSADRRRFVVLYRNLTGEAHTVDTRILFDAAIALEETTGIIRIGYGPLRVDGFVRNFDFSMGIEDASGKFGFAAPGCETSCGDPSRVRNKQFSFIPVTR